MKARSCVFIWEEIRHRCILVTHAYRLEAEYFWAFAGEPKEIFCETHVEKKK